MTVLQRPTTSAPPAPAAPAATPQVAGVPDAAALTAQLTELRIQQVSLVAKRDGLRRQLDQMLQTNPARPGVAQEWANAGIQLADVDGKIAMTEARLAQSQGRFQGTTINIPRIPRSGPDPDMVVGMSLGLLMVVAIPISIAYARRIWRGKPIPASPRTDDIAPRLDRLEQAVDAIAIEIERISEGQRFVTKILADRPASSAAGDLRSPMALGAGPAEPVRLGEKEAVRQGKG